MIDKPLFFEIVANVLGKERIKKFNEKKIQGICEQFGHNWVQQKSEPSILYFLGEMLPYYYEYKNKIYSQGNVQDIIKDFLMKKGFEVFSWPDGMKPSVLPLLSEQIPSWIENVEQREYLRNHVFSIIAKKRNEVKLIGTSFTTKSGLREEGKWKYEKYLNSNFTKTTLLRRKIVPCVLSFSSQLYDGNTEQDIQKAAQSGFTPELWFGWERTDIKKMFIKSFNLNTDFYFLYKQNPFSKYRWNREVTSVRIAYELRNDVRAAMNLPLKEGEGSVSERHMREWLNEIINTKKFSPHYNFKADFLQGMHFDVFYPSLNLAFEFDGAQHFMPVRFGGNKEEAIKIFELTKRRDKKKNEICNRLGIKLVRFKYYKFNKELVQKTARKLMKI